MESEQNKELINKLADVAKVKSYINKDLYTKYNVNAAYATTTEQAYS